MTHYEERLEKDLTRIREGVSAVAGQVEDALKSGVHALLTGNQKLANATVLGDAPINRAVRDIDRMCHAFIALHLPPAGHLRLISAVIRVAIELERIGDYAVTIGRESVQLSRPPEGIVARELERMAEDSRRMLQQAVAAFDANSAEQARATMGMADQVERSFDTVFDELTAEGSSWSTKELFGLFVVFNMLERVSDQAKNICEETVFAATGQTKKAKVYKILFVDEDNSCQSQMAEALVRKNYPNSGNYASAGRHAASAANPAMVDFLEQRGCKAKGAPVLLDMTHEELAGYHVIVGLNQPVKSLVPEVPFHTAYLEWDVGPAPEDGQDAAENTRRLEEMYRELSANLRNLIETLRGEQEAT